METCPEKEQMGKETITQVGSLETGVSVYCWQQHFSNKSERVYDFLVHILSPNYQSPVRILALMKFEFHILNEKVTQFFEKNHNKSQTKSNQIFSYRQKTLITFSIPHKKN